MNDTSTRKVRAEHLKRKAFLYVRQSSLRQVRENTESASRQYALRQTAVDLGWHPDQIVTIDEDQAISAASSLGRTGFQYLVGEVGMGHAGLVFGLEVSRLARCCSDWHKWVEICALGDTLLLDEDGLYDATHFNDRLVLGLKGAMSEAELHIMRARLRGGALNKAKRGELALRLPTGYVRDERGQVQLDPDAQIQKIVRLFLDSFRRIGSAHGTVRYFRDQGLTFPTRLQRGPNKGEVVWMPLTVGRANCLLNNPCYAGAYAYGKSRLTQRGGKLHYELLPRDQWHTLILNAFEGYLTWEAFEANLQRLRANARQRRWCPPGQGPALLQGIVLCGVCGTRMSLRYQRRRGGIHPDYVCPGPDHKQAGPLCQFVQGERIDEAIAQRVLEAVAPSALEVALSVQEEVDRRREDVDRIRRQEVQRAEYEADLARRRFMQADPDHRLVADTLETDWNRKLEALTSAQEAYERQRQRDQDQLNAQTRADILALSTDFPKLWNHPKTEDRDKKRLIRLVIEDVTLTKAETVRVGVRFKGGATQCLTLPRQRPSYEENRTAPELVQAIDHLLEDHTCAEIAEILRGRGLRTGSGKPLTAKRVNRIRQFCNLACRQERLGRKGLLTQKQLRDKLGISRSKMRQLVKAGKLAARRHRVDGRHYMYERLNSGQESGRTLPCKGAAK